MQRGFTLVEVLVAVSVFLAVSFGVYQGYVALYGSLSTSHFKIVAANIVNERFEIIRNLPYASVGTVGGDPSGSFALSESLTRDNISWVVDTSIEYVDDPFDDLAPIDSNPNDYKLVEVQVSCESCKNFIPLVITGIVSPRALEP